MNNMRHFVRTAVIRKTNHAGTQRIMMQATQRVVLGSAPVR